MPRLAAYAAVSGSPVPGAASIAEPMITHSISNNDITVFPVFFILIYLPKKY